MQPLTACFDAGAPQLKMTAGFATIAGGTIQVATSFSVIVAAVASIKSSITPGDDPVQVSADFGGAIAPGLVLFSGWRTDGSDPTLLASTSSTATISYLIIGY